MYNLNDVTTGHTQYDIIWNIINFVFVKKTFYEII